MSTPLPAEAGMSAANRRQVQEALRRLDYYRGRADGIFGPRTRAAIHRFQQTIGAETTGTLTADEGQPSGEHPVMRDRAWTPLMSDTVSTVST